MNKAFANRIFRPLRSYFGGTRIGVEAEPDIVPAYAETEPERSRQWWKPALMIGVLGCAALRPAHAQFLDTDIIIAFLQTLDSDMQTYIAAPLKTINQANQSLYSYQTQVIFPQKSIQQAIQAVTSLEKTYKQVNLLFQTRVSSATLPQSQSFESALLSRNAASVGSVSSQYQAVYGQVMGPQAASSTVRIMTDTTDAQAQDAMKRSIQIDALADQELALADQLGQQIAAAAPGSAPILEAEADAWVVRGNAYTQAALAELMRTRAIDIANQSGHLKIGSTQTVNNGNLITTTLTH